MTLSSALERYSRSAAHQTLEVSNATLGQIWDKLKPHTDQNDTFLVIGVTRDYSGWLTPGAWTWLRERKHKMAA